MATPAARWRDDEAVVAWSAFLRAHAAAVRAIEADLQAGAGIPLGFYDVLLELNAAPGRRLTMQDLGEVAVLSRTRVSRVVDELVGRGYACREPHPDDRRSSFAVITAEGRRALRRAAPTYLDAVRRHFAGALSSGQVRGLTETMETVLAAARPAAPVGQTQVLPTDQLVT